MIKCNLRFCLAWCWLAMTSVRHKYGVVAQASNVTMTSNAQIYVINQGQTLEAMCEFQTDEFHLFENPVVWKKMQRDEEIQINIMGNVFKPFLSTGRFEVAYDPDYPRFCFVLRVSIFHKRSGVRECENRDGIMDWKNIDDDDDEKDVTVEDSGNYTCEVRGPKSTILASVTHTVFVRAPVRQVYLTVIDDYTPGFPDESSATHSASVVEVSSSSSSSSSSYSSSSSSSLGTYSDSRRSTSSSSAASGAVISLPPLPSSALALGGRITFIDGQTRRVGCVALGGNPTPTLRVYLNDRDITGSMEQHGSSMAAHGPPGLRLIVIRTELHGGAVTLSPTDDGSRLRCVAAVSGLAANITETTINVHYGPVIQCDQRYAEEGEFNVYLCCQVRARPHVTSLFWIVDVNGTTLVDGDNTNGYWSMVTDKNHAIETRLYLSRATARSFRPYTLVAENAIAETTQAVRLLRRHSGPSSPPWAALSDRMLNQQQVYFDPASSSHRRPSSPYATSSAGTAFRLASTSRRTTSADTDPLSPLRRFVDGWIPLFDQRRSTADENDASGSEWRLVADMLDHCIQAAVSCCSTVVLVPLLIAVAFGAPFDWTTPMCGSDRIRR